MFAPLLSEVVAELHANQISFFSDGAVVAGLELYSPVIVVSQNRNNGNAGEPSGNWCLGQSTGEYTCGYPEVSPSGKFLKLYM